jgi:hypothetical protein
VSFHPIELAVYGCVFCGVLLVLFYPDRRIRLLGGSFFVGWFLPGAGHALMGRWKKAAFFFLILGVTWGFGMWILGFRPISIQDNPFYYAGQFGCGLYSLVPHVLGAEQAYPRADLPLSWFGPGLLYVCVAGLLNLAVALSVLDAKAAKPAPETAPKPAPETAPEAKPEEPPKEPPPAEGEGG